MNKRLDRRFFVTVSIALIFMLSILQPLTQVKGISAPQVDDYTVQVGDEVTVTGEDVTAGATIKIYWNSVREPFQDGKGLIATTEGQPDGTFEIDVEIPEAPRGNSYIWAKDVSTGTVARSPAIEILPKITATPHRGLPGNTIEVEGTGFTASEGDDDQEIVLMLKNGDTIPLPTSPTTPETDELGSFSASFDVPDIPYGEYTLWATDDLSVTATTAFTVGASITLDPKKGPAGSVATVEGVGFTPYDTITKSGISLDGHDVGIVGNQIEVEGDGEFEGEIVIPSLPVGTYMLNVSDGEKWADAQFEVNGESSITVSPKSGPPGTTITVNGYNFTQIDDTEVDIRIGGTYVKTAKTDSDGTFTTSFQVAKASGTYSVVAEDEYGLTASGTYKVGFVVVIASPDSGPCGEEVTLTGSGFESGGFDAYFDDELVIEDGTVGAGGMITESFYAPTRDPGTYTVRVVDSEENEASTDYEVTDRTALSISSSSAPTGYEVTFTGEHYSQDSGGDIEWVIYTDGWDEEITGDVEHDGDPVELTEYGNFTGTWTVPNDLDLGTTYTINATDEHGLWASTTLTIVEASIEVYPMQDSYTLGDTITFTIRSSFKEIDSYIRIRDPDGDIYFQSTYQDGDWFRSDSLWYVPVRAQYDDVSGNPFILSTTAPTGDWTWAFYNQDDTQMAAGSFTIYATSTGEIGQRIYNLEEAVENMEEEMTQRFDQLESQVTEAITRAEEAKEAAESAESKIGEIESDAEEAKTAAQEASAATQEIGKAVNEIRTLVYIAVAASILAAVVSIVPLVKSNQTLIRRVQESEPTEE
ncbi:MAG: IPT/TIG domain-containing protein [Candidatus Bathyarchaeia archaeon]